MQVLVLGGGGAQAAYAIEKLVADDLFDEIVVADYNKKAADTLVAKLNNPKLRAEHVNVLDKNNLSRMMSDAYLVANCTGPYYQLAVPVIDALVESSCQNYVDLCDDVEVFDKVITPERQQVVRERGMRVILGLGGSPGLIPVEMMYGASLMDSVDAIHLNMLMDELNEGGRAVWDHMLENFSGEVRVWRDGRLQTERGLEQVDEYDFDEEVFPGVGRVKLYTLGHPEIYTLPKVMPDVRDIIIKTSYYPPSVQEMIVDLDRLGMLRTDDLQVGDVSVSPRAVLIESMMRNIFEKPGVKGGWDPSYRAQNELITGSVMEVHGTKDGKRVTYKSSFSATMGPVTGYPLAVGAAMLVRGEIEPVGIMIPEQAVTRTGDFVRDVFTSVKEAGHPLRRKVELIQDYS